MDKLLSLILVVLSDVLPAERKGFSTRRVTTAAIFAALAAFALIGAVGCAVAAIWIYLAAAYGPIGGALGAAAALLIFSGGLLIFARNQFSDESPPAGSRAPLGDELVGELHRLFLRHKGSALLSALIAGLAAGRGK